MFILPTIAIDEYALGYLGRICSLNFLDVRPRPGLGGLVLQCGKFSSRYHVPLAKLLGMTLHSFLLEHALPFALWSGSSLGEPRPGTASRPARFCVECVNQHRQELGAPFWRRAHQLTGVCICFEHGTALSAVAEQCPSRVLPAAKNIRSTREWGPQGGAGWDAIRSYSGAAGFLLKALGGGYLYGLLRPKLSPMFRCRAAEMGLVTALDDAPGRYLSDVAFERFPHDWLEKIFPNAKKRKEFGKRFLPIDDVVCAAYAVPYVAEPLALALMFDIDEWESLILPRIAMEKSDFLTKHGKENVAQWAEMELDVVLGCRPTA